MSARIPCSRCTTPTMDLELDERGICGGCISREAHAPLARVQVALDMLTARAAVARKALEAAVAALDGEREVGALEAVVVANNELRDAMAAAHPTLWQRRSALMADASRWRS